ncbi:class I SAM-dependent methyltransferase [Sphingomonas humi]|uniref:Methyltransferase domain-containing protein n=1 Tax=Sphingomonas humi TaxID=335630 RepID=A0ABP7S365_9SPHN
MPDSDRDWSKWGRSDPYFAVLAHPQFGRETIAEHRDAFFQTGEHYVASVLAGLEASSGAFPRRRALDHGCGTGRLTIPLSRAFEQVVALDVAPEMLAEAERNARGANRDNIHFHQADDRLSGVAGSFDFVLSHLVLQHVPVERGLLIFERLIELVAPGGAFHVSVSVRNDRGSRRALYWASARLPLVKGVQNLLRGDAWGTPAMQMNDYPLGTLVAGLSKRGVQRLTLTVDPYHPRFQTVVLSGLVPA